MVTQNTAGLIFQLVVNEHQRRRPRNIAFNYIVPAGWQ
jgi:hypothetical protein